MTVAFVTEDETDSVVIGALVDRVLGRELAHTHYLSSRGFAAVLKTAAHHARGAARARVSFIIVMVDCDETHDHYSGPPPPHENCRLCRLEQVLPPAHEIAQLSARASRLIPALTVRTIETWLAVAGGLPVPGSVHDFGRTRDERLRLKELVYGDASPTSELMKRRGVDLVRGADLGAMATALNSFGSFTNLLRS